MADVIAGPWEQPASPDKSLPTEPRVSPARHFRVPRQLVPWRAAEFKVALCGKRKGKIRFVDTVDDTTCVACKDKFPVLWQVLQNPLTALSEAIRRERDPRQLSSEIWALTELANRYREEFDGLVALRMTLLATSEDLEDGEDS